uniref:G_PROTEIN_RECEP_F1_2 domain-containing protein n=1 Tax=Rhabditophanes sp. KR3021 TaxID=114890 RepID=A0AC35UF25_9BILA
MLQFNLLPSTLKNKYSCNGLTQEQWKAQGEPNLALGIGYIALGVFFLTLYVPTLIVLTKKELLKNSCYKLLIYLSLIDCMTLVCNAVITGYLTIYGHVFCSHQMLIYITGIIAMIGWTSACFLCIVLALNRCLDIYNPVWGNFLFKGRRTIMWIITSTIYGLFMAFCTPVLLFTSREQSWAWFFDPFHGTTIIHANIDTNYINWPHTINNAVVVVGLSGLYGLFVLMLFCKFKKSNSSFKLSSFQRSLLIQTTLICSMSLIAALIYVSMNFATVDSFLIILGQLTWIMSHSSGSLTLSFCNKTIRNHIYDDFCPSVLKQYFSRQVQPNSKNLRTGNRTITTRLA